METLITDGQQAKAELEIDMNSPASKQDVATYVQNYFKTNIRDVVKQQNITAHVLNLLMDFLSHRGVGNSNHGRYYLNTAEWNEYIVMRKKAADAVQ